MLLTLLAISAQGQTLLDGDDFESGALGAWAISSDPDVTVIASPLAAHSGGFGLHVEDTVQGGGNGVTHAILHTFDTSYPGNLFLRAWVRLVSPSESVAFLQTHGTSTIGTLSEAAVSASGNSLEVRIFDQASASIYNALPAGIDLAEWHLYELSAEGVGTATGRARFWIDGQLALDVTGIDWSGLLIQNIYVGEVYAASSFTGVIDADDVRMATTPNATRLALEGSVEQTARVCSPWTLSLRDASGITVTSPVAASVALSSTLPGDSFFTDLACETPASSASLPVGSGTTTLSFEPGSGGVRVLRAANVDFLSAETTRTVTPAPDPPPPVTPVDAGISASPPASLRYQVGCGCDETAGAPLTLIGFALVLLLGHRSAPRL